MDSVYHRLAAALERRGIAHYEPIPRGAASGIADEIGVSAKSLRGRKWQFKQAGGVPEVARRADSIRKRDASKAKLRERYATDPVYRARLLRDARERRLRDYPYHVFKNTRGNARKRGLTFELSREQIEQLLASMTCSVTGLPLRTEWAGSGRNPWWPSLDQLDPCGGYRPDNVRVVCWAYNVMRGELDDADVRRFAAALLRGSINPDTDAGDRLMARRFGKNRVTGPAHLMCSWRVSARDRELDFDLTYDWLEERLRRGVCEVTGLPLSFEYDGRAHRNPLVPSVDRIDCARGYSEDNVRLVCGWFNYARQDWPDDVVRRVAEGLLRASVRPAGGTRNPMTEVGRF